MIGYLFFAVPRSLGRLSIRPCAFSFQAAVRSDDRSRPPTSKRRTPSPNVGDRSETLEGESRNDELRGAQLVQL
eukprot:59316-Prorocentrum_minimum.AAC.2